MERQEALLEWEKAVQRPRSPCISGFLTTTNSSRLMIGADMEYELFPTTCIPLYSGYHVCIVCEFGHSFVVGRRHSLYEQRPCTLQALSGLPFAGISRRPSLPVAPQCHLRPISTFMRKSFGNLGLVTLSGIPIRLPMKTVCLLAMSASSTREHSIACSMPSGPPTIPLIAAGYQMDMNLLPSIRRKSRTSASSVRSTAVRCTVKA